MADHDRRRQWLAVQVRDCGIGIPARDREHLFERYFRGSTRPASRARELACIWFPWSWPCTGGEVFVESLEGVGFEIYRAASLRNLEVGARVNIHSRCGVTISLRA